MTDVDKMGTKNKELTDKQLKAIEFKLTGLSVTETCKEMRIKRQTWYDWLENEQFAQLLEKGRNAIIKSYVNNIGEQLEPVGEALMSVAKKGDVNAIKEIHKLLKLCDSDSKPIEIEIGGKLIETLDKFIEQNPEIAKKMIKKE